MVSPRIDASALSLLGSFAVSRLGSGDALAGTNVLVSMCAALSSVSGPGASLTSEQGERLPVGISWLLAGALSQELHRHHVLQPLRQLQNAASHNMALARLKLPSVADAKKKRTVENVLSDAPPKPFTPEVVASAKDRMKIDSLLSEHDFGDHERNGVSKFLDRGVLTEPSEFLRRPAFFFDGMDPKLLSTQLPFSHRGHPVVDFAMRDLNRAVSIQSISSGIMDGCGLPTSFPSHVSGFVTARIPHSVLGELISEKNVDWPLRMLWLCDTPATTWEAIEGLGEMRDIHDRFNLALRSVLDARVEDRTMSVAVTESVVAKQREVASHLRRLELQMPGISAALRNLYPTLRFGLAQLADSRGLPKGFKWHGVGALAIYLAERMAHSYTAIRQGERQEALKRLAASICAKLKEGPHTATRISRRHTNLLASERTEVLGLLAAQGIVHYKDGLWSLTETNLPRPAPLVIDVI